MSTTVASLSVASLSALYQETAGLEGSADLFAPIAANPIIQALTAQGVRTEPTLRFTQAACHGAIHPALKPFSDSELRTVQETLDYWQFPKSWSLAISEELAYRHYQTTGELLEPIATPVEMIMAYIECITGVAGDIGTVFSTSKKSGLDSALGRRKIGKQFLQYTELPFFTWNAVRFMLTDLMELMIEGIRKTAFDLTICIVKNEHLAGVRWLAERDILERIPMWTRSACQNKSLPMLKLLVELGVPVEEECWKIALGDVTPNIPLLDFLYETVPNISHIQRNIHSIDAFQWALDKEIPLEYGIIFTTTNSIDVIEELLKRGFVPTYAQKSVAIRKHAELLLIVFLKRKIPLSPEPEMTMRISLQKGSIGAVVNMIRYEMVFDRTALWSAEHPDISLSVDALCNIKAMMLRADYLPVDDAVTHKGFVIGGKLYPCVMTSDVLTIADAIVSHIQSTE